MKARSLRWAASLVLVAIAVAALAGAGLQWAVSGNEGARPAAVCDSAPCYRLTVIGRLPGSVASLPQSIDARGDVAGLSGQVAATSPALEGRYSFDEGTGYAARIFLYRQGRLRLIRPPRSRHGRLFPVNVLLAAPHLLAATLVDASGVAHPFYGVVEPASIAWHPLRLVPWLRRNATVGVSVQLALTRRRLVGWAGEYGAVCPPVWAPDSHGYHLGDCPATGPNQWGYFPRAVDGSLDEVNGDGSAGLYLGGTQTGYPLSLKGLPRASNDACLDLGFYGYDISEAPARHRSNQTVHVADVYQLRCHMVDEVVWGLGIRRGRPRRVAWASKPTLVRGVPPYRDLVVPAPPFRGDYTNVPSNGGGLTPSGQLSGAMGWYRKRRPPQAWCVLSPSDNSGRWKALVPECWTTHDHLHGYIYTGGRTYDLNKRVVNRGSWTVEAATSGVPGSEIFSYGPSMNARGDIIAVGYRPGPNRRLLRACRRSAVWRSKRHLCAVSARRGPETALLLTPIR